MMKIPRSRCIIVFVIIVCCYPHRCYGRSCIDSTLNLSRVNLEFRHHEIMLGTPDNFKFVTVLSWNITGGSRSDFDGYLVRLTKSSEPRVLLVPEDCQASNENLWIKSANDSICDVENQTRNDCNTMRTSNSVIYTACNKDSTAAKDGKVCSGATVRLKKFARYFSIPNTRQNVTYEIKFNTNYLFEIIPYQRQWMRLLMPKTTISANWRCADVMSSSFNLDVIDSRKKCCESNTELLSPFGLNISKPILDATTKTLNITISWHPPDQHASLNGVYMNLKYLGKTEINPFLTEYVTEGSVSNGTGCTRDDRIQTLEAYNLLPNATYEFPIASYFTGSLASKCGKGVCGTRRQIKIDFNPCDVKWTKCDVGTKCVILKKENVKTVPETTCNPIESITNDFKVNRPEATKQNNGDKQPDIIAITDLATTVTATINGYVRPDPEHNNSGCAISDYCDDQALCHSETIDNHNVLMSCSCFFGLVGDGVSKRNNGSGCVGCPILHRCHTKANCLEVKYTSKEFQCQCDEHHFGDGLKLGTGCSSRAKRTLAIVLPIVLIGLVIFAIILRCTCSTSRKKETGGVPLVPL